MIAFQTPASSTPSNKVQNLDYFEKVITQRQRAASTAIQSAMCRVPSIQVLAITREKQTQPHCLGFIRPSPSFISHAYPCHPFVFLTLQPHPSDRPSVCMSVFFSSSFLFYHLSLALSRSLSYYLVYSLNHCALVRARHKCLVCFLSLFLCVIKLKSCE